MSMERGGYPMHGQAIVSHWATQRPSEKTTLHRTKDTLERRINHTVVFFGLWEAEVPGENPQMHREEMPTTCR